MLMKKAETIKSIAIIVLMVAVVILSISLIRSRNANAEASDVEYRPASEALRENGFYPGRIYGDYSDRVFNFDAYLNSIGAEKTQRYMYESGNGIIQELRFEIEETEYKLTTTIFRSDDYLFGLYSKLEIEMDGISYAIPTNNCGTFIMDSNSPFMVDWQVFDVMHASTDPDSGLAKVLRVNVEESNCPLRGLGIDHYEKWKDGITHWHDDQGDFTFDDGLDLHY
jgi:hypothetical protein